MAQLKHRPFNADRFLDKFKGIRADQKAELLKVDEWGERKLAYPIKKHLKGHYVLINFLAAGMTVVVSDSWFSLGGRTPQLENTGRFQNITLPFVSWSVDWRYFIEGPVLIVALIFGVFAWLGQKI